jgi:hypothetical protein
MQGADSILVLYHWPCADGAFAALAARMSPTEGRRMIFVPHKTTQALSIDSLPAAEKVYLLDFCGPTGFMRTLCAKYPSVVLLDHHKTADEEMTKMLASPEGQPSNLHVKLDMNHSGCVIALNYFGVADQMSADTLRIYEYVQDGDLWAHKLPNSKTFTAGLQARNLYYDFAKNPSEFSVMFNLGVADIMRLGDSELERQRLFHEDALKAATHVTAGPFDQCLVFESPAWIAGISELGHQLAERSPSRVGIVAFPLEGDSGKIKLAVRSVGPVDTTHLTSLYGGGGHQNSSGCVISMSEWQKIKKGP